MISFTCLVVGHDVDDGGGPFPLSVAFVFLKGCKTCYDFVIFFFKVLCY